MDELLVTILAGAAILFAIIGLYLVIKAWVSWVRTPDDVLRAKAFITNKFLRRNFKIIFILIVLVATHTFLEFFAIYGYPSSLKQFEHLMSMSYLLLLTVSTFLLALLAYYWLKLLSPPK